MEQTNLYKYRQKINTSDEIAEIIGIMPRAKKVIMCHGTFDVVHPGHIRHLLYAKTKAPILVASLTSDEHIKKGNMRPYVPEELRATNQPQRQRQRGRSEQVVAIEKFQFRIARQITHLREVGWKVYRRGDPSHVRPPEPVFARRMHVLCSVRKSMMLPMMRSPPEGTSLCGTRPDDREDELRNA